MTPRHRWGVLRLMHPLRWLPIDICHPRCAAITTSTGLSIPCCYPSMIYEVFLCDDCHSLFLVVWLFAAYHDAGRYGRPTITWDVWRLIIKVPDVRREYWPVALHIRSFYALSMIRQVFSCSICFQRPWFASPDPRSRPSSHTHWAVFKRQVTCRV